jgi:hypothetical protein
MEVNIKVMVYWYMTLCCLVDRHCGLLTKNAMTLEEGTQAEVREKPVNFQKNMYSNLKKYYIHISHV